MQRKEPEASQYPKFWGAAPHTPPPHLLLPGALGVSPLEALGQGHGVGAGLGVPHPHPALDVLGEDAEELLEHQQLQDLLRAALLGPQPPPGQLPEPPAHRPRARSVLVPELAEPQAEELGTGTARTARGWDGTDGSNERTGSIGTTGSNER